MGFFNRKYLRRIEELERQLEIEYNRNEKLGIHSYDEAMEKIELDRSAVEQEIEELNKIMENKVLKIETLDSQNKEVSNKLQEKTQYSLTISDEIIKKEKQLESQGKKVKKIRQLCKALENAYKNDDLSICQDLTHLDLLIPANEVELKCLTYQDLRKEYRENEKNIKEVFLKYEKRYTTKSNRSIYQLMVLALQSELQNILINMKYDKLEKALETVKKMCQKFYQISSDGNQSIAPTLERFIGEIEYLYINAVKIEYEYYVKKEREKEEQAAIREQMRQEAEERKELERQRKQVENEEKKYFIEIANMKEKLQATNDTSTVELLKQKIMELTEKLSKVEQRKDEIINRQNGKAGNVYIISNLGSFGNDVFKVGMTRRLEPMDRVKELGDASVPFAFDVHAMIFSEDAVALESKLHSQLDAKRLNKVNLRKEFFKLPLDEIEKVVIANDPTASFSRTMLAEQYKQSLSMQEGIK